jgi:hypothetical protein
MMQAEHVSFIEKENHHSGRAAPTATTTAAAALQQQYQYHHFNSHDNNTSRHHETPATTTTRRPNNKDNDWIEKTATIQQALATLITKTSCRLCHVYADKQLEFENRQEDYNVAAQAVTAAVGYGGMDFYAPFASSAASSAGGTLEVELYRQFLFDEESVVGRVEVDEEEEEEETAPTEQVEQQPQQDQQLQPQLHPLQLQQQHPVCYNSDNNVGQSTVVTQE